MNVLIYRTFAEYPCWRNHSRNQSYNLSVPTNKQSTSYLQLTTVCRCSLGCSCKVPFLCRKSRINSELWDIVFMFAVS